MYFLRTLSAIYLFLFLKTFTYAQDIKSDTISNDSLETNLIDVPSDSTYISDTTKVAKADQDIDNIINYTSNDSIRFDVNQKVIFMYGDADIDYGETRLKSEKVEVNWNNNMITSTGAKDSSGQLYGKPVFTDASDEFEADTIVYNIATKRGLIVSAVTQEGEGYIQGSRGLKDEDNNIYFKKAFYTTCNLKHPHFYIGANKLKVIPEDKVVSGPFNLWISDIPTPLGFIFGFFPLPEKNKSGIIFPSNFGEHNSRGFYFTQAGYYLAIKDYAGVAVRGDLYSNGSWRAGISSDYRKRYRFGGSLNFNYSKLYDDFLDNPEDRKELPELYNLSWRHGSQTRGLSRFNANVNVSSSNYYQLNSYNPTTILLGSVNSNISYSTTFRNTPFRLSASATVDQNLVSKVATVTLPDINFAMTRIYPFKKKVGSKNNWYENIGVTYDLRTKFQTTNTPTILSQFREREGIYDSLLLDTLTFKSENFDRFLNRAQYGAQQRVDISTTLKPKKTFLRFFSLNPSVSFRDFWYPEKLPISFNEQTGSLDTSEVNQKLTYTYEYSTNINLNTWIYGTFNLKNPKVKAIRHSMNPTLGFSYKPDFSDKQYGNFVTFTDSLGREQRINLYNGFIYSGPTAGENRNLTFSLNNILEAKVATKDSANPVKKIKLLDQLNLNGSYNFAADSFQLSNINLNAVTRIFGIFDIRYSATLDPYYWELNSDSTIVTNSSLFVSQRRLNRLAIIEPGAGLGIITRSALSVGASLNPQAIKSKLPGKQNLAEPEDLQANAIPYQNLYVDFNIPWNLYVNYILSTSKTGFQSANVNHTLQFNGDLKLSENWKVGFNSGYDIKGNAFTVSRFEIYRDLHCWQMSISAVLFSTQQSYIFTISPKAGILQDLKLNKRSPGSFGQAPLF